VPTTLRSEEDAVVDKFIARYGSAVTAVLSGFDRLVFRGTLLPLVWERGMHTFLARAGVRLLDFKQYAVRTTEQLIARSMQEALKQHRPIPYVPNSKLDKEALARRLLQEHPLQHGLICMFRARSSSVEPLISANSAVTVLRSPSGTSWVSTDARSAKWLTLEGVGPAAFRADEAEPAWRGEPHSPQNLNRGGFSEPHLTHRFSSGVPQLPQNLVPSGLSP
jgi:hypothetical protein